MEAQASIVISRRRNKKKKKKKTGTMIHAHVYIRTYTRSTHRVYAPVYTYTEVHLYNAVIQL